MKIFLFILVQSIIPFFRAVEGFLTNYHIYQKCGCRESWGKIIWILIQLNLDNYFDRKQ